MRKAIKKAWKWLKDMVELKVIKLVHYVQLVKNKITLVKKMDNGECILNIY